MRFTIIPHVIWPRDVGLFVVPLLPFVFFILNNHLTVIPFTMFYTYLQFALYIYTSCICLFFSLDLCVN